MSKTIAAIKKLYLFWSFLIWMTILSCSKEESGFVSATIVGYDLRYCACCGGLLVQPNDANGDTYQWYQKNQKFDITNSSMFPMNVKIKYHHLAESCIASSGEIEITDLFIIK
ncbi:MAG: hypothetical protein IPL08_19300 [Saprospiraceae bacterium]|jgi:hypothetical protein|nr:hypothetical protein [Saprospiraceae bacterium]